MNETVQIPTADLTDLALLWAFSRALGRDDPIYRVDETGEMAYIGGPDRLGPLRPDLNRIVESRRLHVCPVEFNGRNAFEVWVDGTPKDLTRAYGENAITAAMRCLARERFGDLVDVPKEVADYCHEMAEALGYAHPARTRERQR